MRSHNNNSKGKGPARDSTPSWDSTAATWGSVSDDTFNQDAYYQAPDYDPMHGYTEEDHSASNSQHLFDDGMDHYAFPSAAGQGYAGGQQTTHRPTTLLNTEAGSSYHEYATAYGQQIGPQADYDDLSLEPIMTWQNAVQPEERLKIGEGTRSVKKSKRKHQRNADRIIRETSDVLGGQSTPVAPQEQLHGSNQQPDHRGQRPHEHRYSRRRHEGSN